MVENKLDPIVQIEDWGTIDYKEAWDRQTRYHQALIAQKKEGADIGHKNKLILCEHPPVYTLGKSGSPDHLLWDEQQLKEQGMTYYKINRGGDITYHGPGQLVVYPIFDLDQFFRDVHKYVRSLEEVIIRLLHELDIKATRMNDYTGVWIEGSPNRKVCAIGVHLSRWVSMHGLALNVNTNLDHFKGIVPCGIQEDDKAVTSIAKELGRVQDMQTVKSSLTNHFKDIFEFEIVK